jgi:S1-C subfamily serine protease
MTASTELPDNPLATLSDSLASAVATAARSVVAVHARRRIPSSGVVWRPGVIVTAHHTLRRDQDITVTLPDGHTTRATLAGRDPGTDLAILKLDAEPARQLAVIEHAPSSALAVGRLALAIGRPGASVSASFGIVSATGEAWRTWSGGEIDRFVRLDLNIYDGFSGGPLVDAAGHALGINTSALARGLALTIPATTVDRVTDQLLSQGRIRRGYLGLGMQPVRLPASLRHALGAEQADVALLVVSLEADGPADRAGLLLGDVILTVGGHPVTEPGDVLSHLGAERVGQPLPLDVVRGGRRMAITIVVGERPHQEG